MVVGGGIEATSRSPSEDVSLLWALGARNDDAPLLGWISKFMGFPLGP
jgi:hypothetical protein